VVNLHLTYNFDPILLSESDVLEDFMIHLPFISQLEDVLSKPLRRSDNKLDYIPTQYLSEFIKSLDYDGIEYKSSLNTEGYNLAIFNRDNFECINTFVREIYNISYEHRDTL
ncbi:MAG: RES family NAD+ phosphorylase, partial [Candidatus Dadabacteria bacterium]|nr:RES family NAD+ phosphorylase [Candidatus Dadabacteria bacterium]